MTLGAEDEVVELCSDLIRIDTLQPDQRRAGGGGVRRGQARRGRHRADRCWSRSRAGPAWWPASRAPTRPGRRCWCTATSTSSRPTRRSGRVHPFSGEVRDGYVWGRGAVDMKDMDAMTLAVVREWARTGAPAAARRRAGLRRRRGGRRRQGARWLVDNHPELFDGCTEAVSEVGGFSVTVRDDLRLYLVQTAREGHGLAAADRPRPAGARLDAARRQRGDPARARRSPGSGGTSSRWC